MEHKHIRVDQEAHQRFKVSAVIHGDTHTEHANRLLDIADAAADALVALHNIENDSGTIPPAIWSLRCEAVAKLEKVMK